MGDWLTAVAQCQECAHIFAVSVPQDYDGSPLQCFNCGELDATVAIQSVANGPRIDAPTLTHTEHRPHVGKPVKRRRKRNSRIAKKKAV